MTRSTFVRSADKNLIANPGYKMVRRPGESDEELRLRHVKTDPLMHVSQFMMESEIRCSCS